MKVSRYSPGFSISIGTQCLFKYECDVIRASTGAVASPCIQSQSDSVFRFLQSHVNNVMFIRCPVHLNPCQLAHRLFQDLLASGSKKSRYVARVIPVEKTSRADVNAIQEGIGEILAAELSVADQIKQGPWTYGIQIKIRNNTSLKKDAVISAVCDIIRTLCPNAKVDLKSPTRTVSIEVLQKFACLSLLTCYNLYHRYNIQEVGKVVKE